MRLNISNIKFSDKDKARNIRLPTKLTPKLAYLVGIHLGDGSMVYNSKKYDSWISYSGNLTEEYDWYMKYISPLIKGLFNINCYIQEDKRIKRSMIRIYFRSKAILLFLHKVIGLPLGSKQNAGIPKIIKKANDTIKINFLRGFADTEFSLGFFRRNKKDKHKYPTIAYGTSSTPLAEDVKLMLESLGFKLSSRFNFIAWRYEVPHIANYISLNGIRNLELWMKKIGFNSPKHVTKYQIWKKFGFCPSHTNIIQRRAILAGNLDINKFYK